MIYNMIFSLRMLSTFTSAATCLIALSSGIGNCWYWELLLEG